MHINIQQDYSQMSKKAADRVIDTTKGTDMMLYCFPAGDTPTGMIKEVVAKFNSEGIDLQEKRFVSLDEWVGLGAGVPGSCLNYMTNNLYSKINIPKENICFFNALASDLQEQCGIVDSFIEKFGPIGICVLGIGMNGHLGFNESGVSFDLNSHIIDLDETTMKVSAKYFSDDVVFKRGITIGINQIMKAKEVILIASGLHKAKIVKAALEGKVSSEVPASVLQTHDNCHVYLDEAAGSLLEKGDI